MCCHHFPTTTVNTRGVQPVPFSTACLWRVATDYCILQVISAGAVPLIVVCAQEPEIGLKRAAASALSDVVKHGPEQAQVVVDAGAVACLTPLIVNQDCKLKRQVQSPFCFDI